MKIFIKIISILFFFTYTVIPGVIFANENIKEATFVVSERLGTYDTITKKLKVDAIIQTQATGIYELQLNYMTVGGTLQQKTVYGSRSLSAGKADLFSYTFDNVYPDDIVYFSYKNISSVTASAALGTTKEKNVKVPKGVTPIIFNQDSSSSFTTAVNQTGVTEVSAQEKTILDNLVADTSRTITEKPIVDSKTNSLAKDLLQSNPNKKTETAELSNVKLKNPLKSDLNTIPKIINAILDGIVIPIAVPIFILAIIWTGILYVIARGKPTEITKAHEALKWTIIGGAVILGSKLISSAIAGTLAAITNTIK